MTIQDQYLDSFRQTQETWAGVVEYFTKDLQRTFEQPFNPFAVVDPNETIDQIFDFWEKSLEVQRDIAKQLVTSTIATTEKVREQFESAGAAVREQAESAGAAVREQADSVNEAFRKQASATSAAFREQTVKSYDSLTKAELHDELVKRDLPKTGNVDELRERLVADDLK